MQCKTPNTSPLFPNICLLLVWEHDTEKWLFVFLKTQMPLALEEPLSQPTYIMHKEFLFYLQMRFTRAGAQCSVGVNFFCLSPILLSTEHLHTRWETANLQRWCDRCIKAQKLPLGQAPHFTCHPYFFFLAFSHVYYIPDLSVTSSAGEDPHFLYILRLNREFPCAKCIICSLSTVWLFSAQLPEPPTFPENQMGKTGRKIMDLNLKKFLLNTEMFIP